MPIQFDNFNFQTPIGGVGEAINTGLQRGFENNIIKRRENRKDIGLLMDLRANEQLKKQTQKQKERAAISGGFNTVKAMSDIGLDDEVISKYLNNNVLPLLGGGLEDVQINVGAKKVAGILSKVWEGIEAGKYTPQEGLALMGQATSNYPKRGQQIQQSMSALQDSINANIAGSREQRAAKGFETPAQTRAAKGFESPAYNFEEARASRRLRGLPAGDKPTSAAKITDKTAITKEAVSAFEKGGNEAAKAVFMKHGEVDVDAESRANGIEKLSQLLSPKELSDAKKSGLLDKLLGYIGLQTIPEGQPPVAGTPAQTQQLLPSGVSEADMQETLLLHPKETRESILSKLRR